MHTNEEMVCFSCQNPSGFYVSYSASFFRIIVCLPFYKYVSIPGVSLVKLLMYRSLTKSTWAVLSPPNVFPSRSYVIEVTSLLLHLKPFTINTNIPISPKYLMCKYITALHQDIQIPLHLWGLLDCRWKPEMLSFCETPNSSFHKFTNS